MATRQQIRAAIKTLLDPHFTSVFDYRPAQIFEEELPCAAIYFEDGETERDFDEIGITNARLIIEILARSPANIDAQLDQLGTTTENTIKQSGLLNNLVEYISRTNFAYERDPESNSGSLSQTYIVHYQDED